jgi:riboflavin synthase alpha subunit
MQYILVEWTEIYTDTDIPGHLITGHVGEDASSSSMKPPASQKTAM